MFVYSVINRGYVRRYFDVQNRAFLYSLMRDFCDFYAQFLYANQAEYSRCKNMRDFPFYVQNRAPHGPNPITEQCLFNVWPDNRAICLCTSSLRILTL